MALKRTGFAKPTYTEAIAKQQAAQKRAQERAKLKTSTRVGLKRKKLATGKISRKKTILAKLPPHIKAIPESQAHGSGTYQKRLWKITSDYVRIRDWHQYGVCVATGTRIEHWSQGQAGHLKPYSNCNALYKFDVRNIHMQSASSNKWGNRDTWIEYEKVVINRGYNIKAFEQDNLKAHGERLYDSDVQAAIEKMLVLMSKLPELPEYFARAYSLYKKV